MGTYIVDVLTEDIYKDIAEDAETNLTLQILNYIDHCLQGKNKKVIVLLKDGLGGKIMKEFVGLRAKTYSYFKDQQR